MTINMYQALEYIFKTPVFAVTRSNEATRKLTKKTKRHVENITRYLNRRKNKEAFVHEIYAHVDNLSEDRLRSLLRVMESKKIVTSYRVLVKSRHLKKIKLTKEQDNDNTMAFDQH